MSTKCRHKQQHNSTDYGSSIFTLFYHVLKIVVDRTMQLSQVRIFFDKVTCCKRKLQGHGMFMFIVRDAVSRVLSGVHPAILTQVEQQRQATAGADITPDDLRCESACRLLSSTPAISISSSYSYCSAQKLTFISSRHGR